MAKRDAEYKRLGAFPISEKSDLVISEVFEDGKRIGCIVNGFTRTAKYTGPTSGQFVPNDKIAEFKALVAKMT
jgi:hypothetical protein